MEGHYTKYCRMSWKSIYLYTQYPGEQRGETCRETVGVTFVTVSSRALSACFRKLEVRQTEGQQLKRHSRYLRITNWSPITI
jgi:hypothetical protein